MKTIIAPTDYSATANNAVFYAAALAKSIQARLVLLHAYHVPAQVKEVPFTTITEIDLQKENTAAMKKLEKKVLAKFSSIKTECMVRCGFAVDVIKDVAKERKADLIVMGISGAGALGEAILGSVAVDTVRKAETPVVIVPGKAKFRNPGKIVFAYDYSGENDQEAITALRKLVKDFNTKLLVANVISENDTATFKKAIAGIKMGNILADIPHTLHFPVNESVTEGINDFVKDTSTDLVAMIAHDHNVFYRVFNLSSTKRMAFRTEVPLLAIPENISLPARTQRRKRSAMAI